ncbi:WW domain-containing transcription regulator protein 1 isoform X2 [Moschus berezovskii]|uniref:WW domain-containing transcription regulator protein 1 isoform X2 n=1 Tax=Moschus berezovskii TaxID=68408 RepID=UPI002443DAA3|nr:WW domain-containing transcription regulator protein 1 isoform X2 [Moschus berezovskii]
MNPASAPPPLPPPGQQVIHVTQDLDTDLEALFNSVMNPKPSSWRKKILPESFFKEPDSGSHSRQSSTDSSGGHPGPRLAGGAQHVRSHSSPASLQLGTGAGAAVSPAQQHAHLRQQSYDVTDELPLPPGWEMTFTATGQRYFLNHIEKITTWQDPRKAMNQPLNHMNLHPAATSTPVPQRSMAVSQPNLVMNRQHPQQLAPSSLSQQSHPPQSPSAGLMSMPNALTTQQQQQQKLRLQRIQMERERIRMRQEELMRQEAALCRQLPMEAETLATVQAAVNPPAMTPDMRSITNNSSDPFLNGHEVMDSVATSWTVAHQALLSMGFPRQEYWSGLPFPSLGDLPDLGIKPRSSVIHCQFLILILLLWLCIMSSGKMHTGCTGTLYSFHIFYVSLKLFHN